MKRRDQSDWSYMAERVSQIGEATLKNVKTAPLLSRDGRKRSKFAHAGTKTVSGKLKPCMKPHKKCSLRFYGDTADRVFCLADKPCWMGENKP